MVEDRADELVLAGSEVGEAELFGEETVHGLLFVSFMRLVG